MAILKYRTTTNEYKPLMTSNSGSGGSVEYKMVTTLPSTGLKDIIYLVPSTNPEGIDIYNEFIYFNNKWERLGSRDAAVDVYDECFDEDFTSITPDDIISEFNKI